MQRLRAEHAQHGGLRRIFRQLLAQLNLPLDLLDLQLFEHISRAGDQLAVPLLNDLVRPLALRRGDRARHREDLAALVERRIYRMPGARLESRLGDQRAQRHAGQDAVAAREVVRLGPRAQRVLAEHRAAARIDDSRGQIAVLARVELVQPARHHRQGSPAPLQRRLVGQAVHAVGQAADDRQPGVGQLGAEFLRDLLAVGAGAARADHGDRPLIAIGQLAVDKEQRGRVGDLG